MLTSGELADTGVAKIHASDDRYMQVMTGTVLLHQHARRPAAQQRLSMYLYSQCLMVCISTCHKSIITVIYVAECLLGFMSSNQDMPQE